MAIVKMDGFDLYGDTTGLEGSWSTVGTPSLGTATGRFGGGGVTVNGNTSEGVYLTDTSGDKFITAGFAFKSDMVDEQRLFCGLSNTFSSNSINGAVLLNTDGSITVEGDGGINLASSAAATISANSWYYIEVQLHKDAAGSIEVFVNGTSVVSASGDTEDGAANILLFGTVSSGSTNTTVYDDVYLATDASALPAIKGDVVIETVLPNADTAQADWTLSAGTDGFALIDDALGTNGDGDTTYISETTLGNKSEFDLENISASPTSVHAVAIRTRAAKTDAGTIEYTQYIDSSGTEGAGSAIAPAESVYNLSVSDIYETDPNTASAWTEAGVNALKLGVEITG